MKSIRCWQELGPYGIHVLTGEACGLTYRLLCDVTARGQKTLTKALGVRELALSENWNQGPVDDPHVGSILLPPESLTMLGVFALLEAGCREVWLTHAQHLIGLEVDDSAAYVEAFRHRYAGDLVRRFAYAGTAGDRNRHEMTGRVY